MLCSLTIQNIALIEKAYIDFQNGFTTLTGETGAGKSIIIDAVNLVLGERADRDLIRTGEEFALVDALFQVGEKEEAFLQQIGVATAHGEVVLSRRITRTGRGSCRINGSLVPLVQLRAFTSQLVDIHGQHEHQSLLQESKHGAYLDAYAQKALSPILEEIHISHQHWMQCRANLRQLAQNSREIERNRDMFLYEISEIDAVKLRDGEEEELVQLRDTNRNAEKIQSALSHTQQALIQGSTNVTELLQSALHDLDGIRSYTKEYQELYASIEDLYYLSQDVGYTSRALLEGFDFDPMQAEQIEQRLDAIHTLERKYGSTIREVLQWREDIQQKLDQIDTAQFDMETLQNQLKAERRRLFSLCEKAHAIRKEYAKHFEQEVLSQLADLGMERAAFSVEIVSPSSLKEAESCYTENGFDQIRFLLTVNPGEPLKPLSKTASGGEMSRIMLAMKTVLSLMDDIPTLIFDEIDTGISGRMAQVVAQKMAQIGSQRQVLCVTHLPQIAAMGDQQMMVEKTFDEDKTVTRTISLTGDARYEEISRMISGAGELAMGLNHAKNMLESAKKWKEAFLNAP